MSDELSLPNPLDGVLDFIQREWPELLTISGIWLTGGQVWRRLLGYPIEEAKDVDFVCVTKQARIKMERLLWRLGDNIDANDTYVASATPLGGELFFTCRGRVDLWSDTGVVSSLRRYSNAKRHARAAFNTSTHALIWLPSEVKRKPGEKYIHCEPEWQARGEDGVMEIHSAKLEWRVNE